MMLFEFPFMPPTINHAYINIEHGRILSTEARKYKLRVKDYIIHQYPEASLSFSPNAESVFEVEISMYFPALRTKTKGAKNIYRKIDVSNRVKLFEDAVFESLGIDDSRVFSMTLIKKEGPEKIIIWIEEGIYDNYC